MNTHMWKWSLEIFLQPKLFRAMEFVVALLLRLYDDKSVSMGTAASEAYHQTLYQFHTWYTSAAFQLALKVRCSQGVCM